MTMVCLSIAAFFFSLYMFIQSIKDEKEMKKMRNEEHEKKNSAKKTGKHRNGGTCRNNTFHDTSTRDSGISEIQMMNDYYDYYRDRES